MATCAACGAVLDSTPGSFCPVCGAPTGAGPAPSTAAPPVATPAGSCPNCKSPMTKLGELQFRVGGYARGAGMLLGNLNQLAENLQPFSVYHCPACRRFDLYEPGV
jgi:hypothetical protein